MNWKLRAGQRLRMLSDDEETVVYNDLSGDTHLLSGIAASLLERLRQGPADHDSLAGFLASEWDLDPDIAPAVLAEQLLCELAALSLIEPTPS
jgi:PqqD family protein of HPr-rel-A system